jgi:hypothetical protein
MPGLLKKLEDMHLVSHVELAFAKFMLFPGNPLMEHIPISERPAVQQALTEFESEASAKIAAGSSSSSESATTPDAKSN